MKLLFVHDHKFRSIQGKIYSIGGLSNDALIRYTNAFGYVTIIARVLLEENANEKYSEITNNKIEIKNGLKLSNRGFLEEVENADCIISRMPSFFGLKAIKLAKKLKKPCIIEMVACPWDSLWNHSLQGKIIAPYMTLATKKVVKKASCVSYVTKKFLQVRYPTRGITVSCSNVLLPELDMTILDARLKKISTNNNKIILGTAAALDVRFKGQQYVIKALGQLKKQGIINYEYQLVGSGDLTYLYSVAEKYDVIDQVKFLGSKPHNKVFEWLDSIDVYIQPSRQEGLPRALIEAMSRGLPALGAKTGGIPELLEENYIFSNTKKNTDEICANLLSLNVQNMHEQAKRNFMEAKNYNRLDIERRREAFFHEFINSIEGEALYD